MLLWKSCSTMQTVCRFRDFWGYRLVMLFTETGFRFGWVGFLLGFYRFILFNSFPMQLSASALSMKLDVVDLHLIPQFC
jgi:hypothetical protein